MVNLKSTCEIKTSQQSLYRTIRNLYRRSDSISPSGTWTCFRGHLCWSRPCFAHRMYGTSKTVCRILFRDRSIHRLIEHWSAGYNIIYNLIAQYWDSSSTCLLGWINDGNRCRAFVWSSALWSTPSRPVPLVKESRDRTWSSCSISFSLSHDHFNWVSVAVLVPQIHRRRWLVSACRVVVVQWSQSSRRWWSIFTNI